MTFTDDVLLSTGEWMFRKKKEGETIEQYRESFAQDQDPKDPVQAHEIRTGKPWDEWDDQDVRRLAFKNPELLSTNPMMIAKAFEMLGKSSRNDEL